MSKMSELDYEKRMAADQLSPSLREAAQAVIDRWESPNWVHDAVHTGELIFALREVLREDALAEMQALTESEYRENTLVRLSETHQQLDAELGEVEKAWPEARAAAEDQQLCAADLDTEYEFIGRSVGTYGGRWVLVVEDKAAVWPDGTAVYVRRIKR
jgi:hypothetical protein